MEQIFFGERIAAYRKEQGLTQEGLAQKLGVTNQAVSKWESDQCCPDIMLLPALADVFHVSLDELFGRAARETAKPEPDGEDVVYVDGLPWPDDDDLRAVCYVGHRLVDHTGVTGRRMGLGGLLNFNAGGGNGAELHFSGTVRDIHSEFGVVVKDSTIAGSVSAGGGVECGDVGGSIRAGDGINCGAVGGNVSAGDSVYCGDVGGSVRAGDGVSCGDVGGGVSAGDGVNCGNVEGDIRADSVACGNVSGSIQADRVISGGRF